VVALTLLVPVAAACGEGDEQGRPLERDTTENPNGGGQPADDSTSTTATDDTTDATTEPGQPQSGTDESGENQPTQSEGDY
jgi:hypothetical protein